MADPLSVAASCVGLICAAGATIKTLSSFVRDCRAARSDLAIVARELADLQLILELLKDDSQGDALPGPLHTQIDRVVRRCSCVVSDINTALNRCRGISGAVVWAADGKNEVDGLRKELAAYRESLSLTVETTTLLIARCIKADTAAIRDQNRFIPGIRDNTEKILEEIRELRTSYEQRDEQTRNNSALVEDYLDGLITYAESVCEEVNWDFDEEPVKKVPNGVVYEPKATSNHEARAPNTIIKQQCQECRLFKLEKGCNLACGHWLCYQCVQSKIRAASQPPYPTPICCRKGNLSPWRITEALGYHLKKGFNNIWFILNTECPRKKCHQSRDFIVLKSSPYRRVARCKCNQPYCTWCEEKCEGNPHFSCERKAELQTPFDLNASDQS
ncbi:hypothetical protein CGCTS75_v001460 [Colletotrichum tropicale]|nr:hypothetical protein CGCTS75_v001460 [Colletotrichum tropicale]